MTPLIAGNWKMNGLGADLKEINALVAALADAPATVEVLVCPPATLLRETAGLSGPSVGVGGQDCHAEEKGAHTGAISAEMLKDAGASYVIVGHSEARERDGLCDADVRAKAEAGLRAGLTPIVCIGESLEERKAGRAMAVLAAQVKGSLPETANVVLAYEPIWAIGTGESATVVEIAEAHAMLRDELVSQLGEAGAGVRILYGGSVKPGNAAEILGVDHVNGALVGGASLKADDFLGIIQAA